MRRLRNEIPDFAYDAWIAPLAVKISADQVVLGCPTSFHRDRVRLHHLEGIERCWRAALDAADSAPHASRAPIELLTPSEFAEVPGRTFESSALEEMHGAERKVEMRKVEAASNAVGQARVANAGNATIAAGTNASTPIARGQTAAGGAFRPSRPEGPNLESIQSSRSVGSAGSAARPVTDPIARRTSGTDSARGPGSADGGADENADENSDESEAAPGSGGPAILRAVPCQPTRKGAASATAGSIAHSRDKSRDTSDRLARAEPQRSSALEFGLDGGNARNDPRSGFDDFIVGPCNALAREATLALARRRQQSLNQLYLGGAPGMGKTHLARAAADEVRFQAVGVQPPSTPFASPFASSSATRRDPRSAARVIFTSAEQFTSEFVSAMRNGRNDAWARRYRGPIDLLVVEDIQYLVGRTKTQQELYHTIEHVLDAGGRVLLTGDRAPRDLTGLDERMRALVARGFVAELDRPDALVRRHILRAKAAAGGIHLPTDCLDLLVDSAEGSVRDVEGVLIQVVTTASLLGCPIDLALTREAIDLKSGASSSLTPRKLEVSEVVRIVASFFGTRPEVLASRSRRRDVLVPRQLAMYLAHRYTEASLTEIGRGLGRDHPSVRNAIQRIERQVLENAPVRYQVEALCERIDRSLDDAQ